MPARHVTAAAQFAIRVPSGLKNFFEKTFGNPAVSDFSSGNPHSKADFTVTSPAGGSWRIKHLPARGAL